MEASKFTINRNIQTKESKRQNSTSEVAGDEDEGGADGSKGGREESLEVAAAVGVEGAQMEIGNLNDPSDVAVQSEGLPRDEGVPVVSGHRSAKEKTDGDEEEEVEGRVGRHGQWWESLERMIKVGTFFSLFRFGIGWALAIFGPFSLWASSSRSLPTLRRRRRRLQPLPPSPPPATTGWSEGGEFAPLSPAKRLVCMFVLEICESCARSLKYDTVVAYISLVFYFKIIIIVVMVFKLVWLILKGIVIRKSLYVFTMNALVMTSSSANIV